MISTRSCAYGRLMSNVLTFAVLGTVALILFRDLGHRRVTLIQLWRPLLVSLAIVPFVMPGWDMAGNGLLLELAALLAGLVFGLLTFSFMKVTVDGAGTTWTDAGVAYAVAWIVLAGARSAFIYGCQHWFTRSLGMFLVSNHISVDAFADSILLLSLVPIVVNRLAIMIRGRLMQASAVARPVQARLTGRRASRSRR
jgi:hypothetical protein